jgi:hypothetical protein
MYKWAIGSIAGILMLVISLGYFVPLESYTAKGSCGNEEPNQIRLSKLKGDSLQKVRDEHKSVDFSKGFTTVNEGCSITAKYTLYYL